MKVSVNGSARALLAAGVCAALHVAKVPPAVPALQAALGVSLVQAGFLLSVMQLAGMCCGVAFGAWVDGLGHRRSLLAGLVLLALASAWGGFSPVVGVLMALRVLEGCAFLLVVLAVPSLLRQAVAGQAMHQVMGLWSAYMPVATALAFLCGPLVLALAGWRVWWWLLAALTAAVAWWVMVAVPQAGQPNQASQPLQPGAAAPAASGAVAWRPWLARLALTLRSPGPWCVALCFGCYGAQWISVIGFLPTVYAQAGWSAAVVALLSASIAGANVLGNVAAGRWLQRGVPSVRLLRLGCVAMAAGALLAFAEVDGQALPPVARVLAVLMFSMCGGVIPATLFGLALRLAPRPDAVGTSMGWLQQLSATGQFCGPPLVAWIATRAGGWHFTGWVTAAMALAALALAQVLHVLLQRQAAMAVSPSPPSPI